jgi:hypothetical protein
MNEIRKHVESILNSYPDMKQQLKVMEFELDSLQPMLDPRVIEDKVFAHSGADRVSGVQPRDRTADIVIEHVDGQRDARYHALKSVVYTMSHEICRLEYYLSLLQKEDSAVLRHFYFEGMNLAAIAKSDLVSQSTVQRRKKRGFATLVKYYSALDSLSVQGGGLLPEARFISYLHEERYAQCMSRLTEMTRTPDIEAMMYIISGCNELWNAGIDTFINFETWEVTSRNCIEKSFSTQGEKLLLLTYYYALGFDPHNLSYIINSYFPGLEHVHLELAIESLRVARFFSPK